MLKDRKSFGFLRIATAVPSVQVADCVFNAERINGLISRAQKQGAQVLFFPELSLTGYTCADLFQQRALLDGAVEALEKVRTHSLYFNGIIVVGLPLIAGDTLYNCAVVIKQGHILGAVPKSYLPNYKEFYEARWFSPAGVPHGNTIEVANQKVPFGNDLLFKARDCRHLVLFLEICEDLWVTVPPSSFAALAGATLIGNCSASNGLIGKADYRASLVTNQSARCMAAYAYTSAGIDESTTDVVFDGHMMIAENGSMLAENERFQEGDTLQIADIDLERLVTERLRTNSFAENRRVCAPMLNFRTVEFDMGEVEAPVKLARRLDAHPFVPAANAELAQRCWEIFSIQTCGLRKRLKNLRKRLKKDVKVTIGVSGGLDSTLALVAACKTFDRLGYPRSNILGYTMPGFGTTARTKNNAHALMRLLGITAHEVDIRAMCFQQWLAEGYKPFGIDLQEIVRSVRKAYFAELRAQSAVPEDADVDFIALAVDAFNERLKELPEGAQDLKFENTQARFRTKILMDAGFVVGTGDLSEAALGWCTYNGDHMSMYNVNCSVPKTLVKFLVQWTAENVFDGETRAVLQDIVATKISPELLPTGKDGQATQLTEDSVGPYELHDFTLYYMLRWAMSPEKILYLAQQAQFKGTYTAGDIRRWLKAFIVRFFTAQFKRSCVPDGPKVGSASLSPRGDWRMPSDAETTLWLQWAESSEPVKRALGLVDAINAFASAEFGGELPVPVGEQIGEPIGQVQATGSFYAYQFAGNDRHKPTMFNFSTNAPDGARLVPDRDGVPTPVWPPHAVENTWGADFLPGVRADLLKDVFPKGDDDRKDSYSACGNVNLIGRLREERITHVDLAGLVFRICVGMTAVDLAKAGFKVRVITDCTRDLPIADFQHVIDEMKALGVQFVTSEQVRAEAAQ